MHQKKSKGRLFVISIILLMFTMLAVCAVYLTDYYHADMDEIEDFVHVNKVETHALDDHTLVFKSEKTTTGFIFYPGGKVEYTAYIPLMNALASEGILCVLVDMPFHLAVLDIDAADGIQERYPEIEDWYIGGHSLGGSMAASYLVDHADHFEGLILLGSYSVADLSETDHKVLSIYGSEDQVLNREKYEENKSNLPTEFSEIVIDGGCHAYFGMYGEQDGDGTPWITNVEQIEITVKEIVKFAYGCKEK
ncbi:MAG: alpha/beta hydrolase [Lachnospiraceae bacterium]|nr:alpha/beta hydrolase [Lachnospiraceae bacterium]